MPNGAAITATSHTSTCKTHSEIPLPMTEKHETTGITTENPQCLFQKQITAQSTPPLNNKLISLLGKNNAIKEKPESERDAMEQAICTACTLWENPVGIQRIEIISPDKINLPMIVLNRRGFLNEPHTWGKETRFIILTTDTRPNTFAELDQYIRDTLAPNNAHYDLETHFDINLLYQPHPAAKQEESEEKIIKALSIQKALL